MNKILFLAAGLVQLFYICQQGNFHP